MIRLYIFLVFVCFTFILHSQTRVLTISNGPNVNITGASPFQPIDPTIDANLNITTLINSLALQNTVVRDIIFISFEIAVIEDVSFNSLFDLQLESSNSILFYADLKNDGNGDVDIDANSSIIVGTDLSYLPFYNLTPLPNYQPPPLTRSVEVGSAHGNTDLNAAIYIGLFGSPGMGEFARVGRQVPSLSAFIGMYAGNYIVLQGGGTDAYAQVGIGGRKPGLFGEIDADIQLRVEEGNINVVGGGFDAYAQIGHVTTNGLFILGRIDVEARSVQVNTPMNGNTFVEAGPGDGAEARIGHWHRGTQADDAFIRGDIISIDSSSLIIRSGPLAEAHAVVGHLLEDNEALNLGGDIVVEAKYFGVLLDGLTNGGGPPSHCMIGHSGFSLNDTVRATDSIYINSFRGPLNGYAGFGDEEYVLIGHHGRSTPSFHNGHIEINLGDTLHLESNLSILNYAQIGHLNAFGGTSSGNITIRSGGLQRCTAEQSNQVISIAQVGHFGTLVFPSDIYMLSGDNINFHGSMNPPGAPAIVHGLDTVRILAADSISALGNDGGVIVDAVSNHAVVEIEAISDISFVSSNIMSASINALTSDVVRVHCSGDIVLSQPMWNTLNTTGFIEIFADRVYLMDELYSPQFSRSGPIFNLGGNPLILPDLLGVARFENPFGPTVLQTIDGKIDIQCAETSPDGTVRDLTLSNSLAHSLDPKTINGSIFIGMGLGIGGQPMITSESYNRGFIRNWNSVNNGHLYFRANESIESPLGQQSYIDMQSSLLFTN